ncbi:MAG: hypothetical protein EOO36_18695 [Cytophagaceae bacterium]|nr:MAG: hypothetical protein EOO36_18695 [Cytophagaceae bacterium]
MKIILLACTLLSAGFISPKAGPWFSGKIVYHNTFKTLAGQDISDKLAPVFGSDDPYYIGDNNYKMYTENKQLVELYTGATNEFRFFVKGQAMPVLDAAKGTPGTVKLLTQTATVAGYACQSLEITNEADGTQTVFFYAPKLRVNPERFTKHAMGDFYTYLKASNGALPLRMVVTNTKQGFSMTSEATSVTPMPLTAADFTVEAPAR